MGKKNCSIGLCDMQTIIHCCIFIFFVGGLATISFYKNNKQEVSITVTLTNVSVNTIETLVLDHQRRFKSAPPPSLTSTCDLFSGRWVHDNKTQYYPLYKEHECPYLEETFACQTYGRKDTKYLHWRWQPHGCNFPRFDAKAVVERLRGKRLLFVGDSLNRNQWNSMICMLHSSIPGVKSAGADLNGLLYTFRATDYNISVDFYWAPMLVESNGDSPTNHHGNSRMVAIKEIEKHARHWVNSDILIFNSFHWWRSPELRLLKSAESLLDDHPNQEYEEVDCYLAYKMGLKTWSDWVRAHIDPLKTKLYFMGATATHSKATDWGGVKHGNCYRETEPVMDDRFWESQTDLKMMSILESSMSELKATGVNVQIINITQLTQCRKDAHTTVYRKHWRPLTEEQKKNPQLDSDCSHWCVPGVPDIWNELLLASIFQ
ncbi:hypothetical protein R6Q57_017276 [Mikania cordata]